MILKLEFQINYIDICMAEFDYKYYLETYNDLRHLNYQQAYSHFHNFGIK